MSILDPDILIEKAQQLARTDDLLGDAWQPAFRTLVDAIDREAGLSPARVERVAAELLGLLVTRARVAARLRATPAIAEAPLPAPVVITGLPRSGTTLLHNLLARYPGNRAYRLWELRAPAFPLGAPVDQARRERDGTAQLLAWLYEQAPEFRSIHAMEADAPDECNWLLRPTFTTPVFAWTNYAPSYDRFLAQADARPAYREWALMLRMLRWRSPGGIPVLKDPGHLWSLPALLQACPDARVIVMSRDLRESVPSLCSLCASLQRMQADPPPPPVLGRAVLAMVERGLRTLAHTRAQAPDRLRVVDYRRLVANPVGTADDLQAWLGRPVDPLGRQRAQRFLDQQPRHPRHRYQLGDYGLHERDVAALSERAGAA